jgi:hypothetical protein
MNEVIPERAEPRGCTLADLMALTLGAAIAASLYWYSSKSGSITILGRLAPSSYVWFNSFLEILQKSCVALTPVILHRRWRSGGPLRPVEYLPILIAIGQVSFSMWQWPVFGIVSDDPRSSSGKRVDMEAVRIWKLAQCAVGGAAALLVFVRRKRAPDWLFGVLVAIAWDRLVYAGETFYQAWGYEFMTSYDWPNATTRLLSSTLVQLPIGLIVNVPLAIALVDLGRGRARPATWVERASAWLGLSPPLLVQVRYFAQGLILAPGIILECALRAGLWAASIGLAYLLARAFEPAWRRALEGSRDHAGLKASCRTIT